MRAIAVCGSAPWARSPARRAPTAIIAGKARSNTIIARKTRSYDRLFDNLGDDARTNGTATLTDSES